MAPAPGFADPPAADQASLLLVTLDTFRADAAGCGGSPVGRTPHLDRLARHGLQFSTGLAATPLTAPSHASILTGTNPPEHSVRDNGSFRLPEGIPTLAAALAARGFDTAGFVTAFPLDARFGFARGFSAYDQVDAGASARYVIAQRPGVEAVAAARGWWTRRSAASRWFVWIHLFDAHTPYDAPRYLLNASGRDPYLADVAVADAALGAALVAAAETGQPFWAAVLGDHGESRGEHGEATHGLFIYGSTTRIPAVIWPAPAGSPPGLHEGAFRQIDFPATAFELLGLAPGDAPGTGHPVERGGPRPAYLESLYARLHYGWAPLTALQEGRWKYIEAPEPELYDLENDPGERDNVAPDHPDVTSSFAATLDSLASAHPATAPAALDPTAREALAALGYLSDQGSVRTDAPDPKRMVAVEALISRAQSMMSSGNLDAAAVTLGQAIARDPRNKELHQIFGQLHVAAGRDGMAVDSYRKALELPPHVGDRVARFELACAYLRLGKPGEAVAPLEAVLREDPEDAPTWYNLGVAREALGQLDRAREAWRKSLELDPTNEFPRNALARTGGVGATRETRGTGS